MLARELAARATALDRHTIQVDTHLIERAALTLAPERRSCATKVLPVFGDGELLASLRRAVVWRQRERLFGGDGGHASSRLLPDTSTPLLHASSLPVCPKR